MTQDELLRDRVIDLRAWAASRIDQCRRQEEKFGGVEDWRGKGPPQSLVEAWTERRALQAVLGILEGKHE